MERAYFNWSSGKDSALAHSFVFDGPIFKKPVDFQIVRKYHRDYTDIKTKKMHRYCYLELK